MRSLRSHISIHLFMLVIPSFLRSCCHFGKQKLIKPEHDALRPQTCSTLDLPPRLNERIRNSGDD
jgi:hypothetical protein